MPQSASQQPFYITTAIDYVNAPPHLGHAYEKIATDIMARYQRLRGNNVFFLTGTDEHGIKIEKIARERGIEPKTHADETVAAFKACWQLLNISYDRFVRTTEPAHYALVEALWRKLKERGHIYKHSYEGLYCSGCEAFLTVKDLNDKGECLIHLRKPEPIQEENYFFRLTAFKQPLLDHLQQNPDFVQPAFRQAEIVKFLEEVEDISISRSVNSVSWGIPVPDDPEQRIYVWIDALSNYITGVDYNVPANENSQKTPFWPANYHIIGKDILRFHAVYWPAMLLAADIPLPKHVFAHGFININDAKISKSLGNVISPQSLMERFQLENSDPIRYYLMTCATFGNDGSFSDEEMKLKVNADLSNNLGNLLNRTLNMAAKYFEGQVPSLSNQPLNTLYQQDEAYWQSLEKSELFTRLKQDDEKLALDYTQPVLCLAQRENQNYLDSTLFFANLQGVADKFERFDYEFALFTLFGKLIDPVNLFIQEKEPWTLAKENNTEALAAVLYSVLERLRQVAILLSPVIPVLSANVLSQLGYRINHQSAGNPEVLGDLCINGKPLLWQELYTPLPYGQALNLQGPILPRLDSELAGAAKKQ